MKQSALEFLLKKITLKNRENEIFLYPIISNEIIEQAKEMEKQQIIEAYNSGQQIPPFDFAEQYYNEKFNK